MSARDDYPNLDPMVGQLAVIVDQVSAALDEIDGLRSLLAELVAPDECHYDHHGYCQAHSLHDAPCPHARAKALLALTTPDQPDRRSDR